MSWSRIIGILLLFYGGFVIYRGKLTSADDYGGTRSVSREKNPIQFWLLVGLMFVIAFVLVFNLVHF